MRRTSPEWLNKRNLLLCKGKSQHLLRPQISQHMRRIFWSKFSKCWGTCPSSESDPNKSLQTLLKVQNTCGDSFCWACFQKFPPPIQPPQQQTNKQTTKIQEHPPLPPEKNKTKKPSPSTGKWLGHNLSSSKIPLLTFLQKPPDGEDQGRQHGAKDIAPLPVCLALDVGRGSWCFNQVFLSQWRNKWVFPSQIIYFHRVFQYKPSILRYPYFWKHPNKEWGSTWGCLRYNCGIVYDFEFKNHLSFVFLIGRIPNCFNHLQFLGKSVKLPNKTDLRWIWSWPKRAFKFK